MYEQEMTQEELIEGIANLEWLAKNGNKLIEAMFNPTWPKKGGAENAETQSK